MNPYATLRLLQERIKAEVGKLHLDPISVVFMAADDGSDLVQIVFKLLPESMKTDAEIEADKYKNVFEDIMSNMQVLEGESPLLSEQDQELSDRIEETRRKLEGMAGDDTSETS